MTTERQGRSSRFDHASGHSRSDNRDDGRAPGKRTLTSKLSAPAKAKDPHDPSKSEAKSEPETEQTTHEHEHETSHDDESGQASLDTTSHDDESSHAALESTSDAELREAETWLSDVQTALATSMPQIETHVCNAACVHGQFDRMLSGYGGTTEDTLDVAALQAAYKAWLKTQKANNPQADKQAGAPTPNAAPNAAPNDAGDQAEQPESPQGDAAPSPAPQFTPDPTGDAPVGHAGTVSPKKHPRFPDIMGEAPFPTGYKIPEVKLKTKQEDVLVHQGGPTSPGKGEKLWITLVEPTTSADASSAAIATPADTYTIPGTVSVEDDDGKKIVMTRAIKVSTDAANQIRQAEQEHVDDYTQAYTITLKAAEKAVNDAVALDFSVKDKATSIKMAKDAIKNALHPRLTENPQTWVAMLNECLKLSKSGRDASHTHDFTHHTQLPDDANFKKKVVTGNVLPNTKLGKTTSADLIKL